MAPPIPGLDRLYGLSSRLLNSEAQSVPASVVDRVPRELLEFPRNGENSSSFLRRLFDARYWSAREAVVENVSVSSMPADWKGGIIAAMACFLSTACREMPADLPCSDTPIPTKVPGHIFMLKPPGPRVQMVPIEGVEAALNDEYCFASFAALRAHDERLAAIAAKVEAAKQAIQRAREAANTERFAPPAFPPPAR